MEVKSEISKSNLPKVVTDVVEKEYADFEIEEIAKIEALEMISYEV